MDVDPFLDGFHDSFEDNQFFEHFDEMEDDDSVTDELDIDSSGILNDINQRKNKGTGHGCFIINQNIPDNPETRGGVLKTPS